MIFTSTRESSALFLSPRAGTAWLWMLRICVTDITMMEMFRQIHWTITEYWFNNEKYICPHHLTKLWNRSKIFVQAGPLEKQNHALDQDFGNLWWNWSMLDDPNRTFLGENKWFGFDNYTCRVISKSLIRVCMRNLPLSYSEWNKWKSMISQMKIN